MATLTPILQNDMYALRGKSLSIPEITALQASLVVLSEKNHFSRVSFWGKILGYQNDYYIAEVLSATDVATGTFGLRTAYYSVDGGVNWTALPSLTQDQVDFSEQLRGRFIGQPDFAYKIRRDIPPEPEVAPELPAEDKAENDEEDGDGEAAADEEKEEGEGEAQQEAVPEEENAEGEEKVPKKLKPKFQIISMTEACRVAHFVAVHNKSCLLVPRGAFVLKSPGNIFAKNRTFSGLSPDDAMRLSSYFHVDQNPLEDLSKNHMLYGPTFSATTDFLRSIAEDTPEGVWSLQYDATHGVVTLENLLYEGSLFYLKVDSAEYGQVYFGTGERNLDLCFVLP